MLTGSIGMLPSASLDARGKGLYEPVHGSAPDIAGKNLANPIGAIASAAMLLRHALGLEMEAAAIEHAIETVLRSGLRTRDLAPAGEPAVGTREMATAIATSLERRTAASAAGSFPP